jgi:GTPase SAR1 family protein
MEVMPRFAQLIIGPAGSGKSSYVSSMISHGQTLNRVINGFNLDPAAEQFDYEPMADIRQLINIDDIMADEELRFGPNGGLVFAMEYLLENSDWFEEQLMGFDDDYILFDTAGQIELSTHLDIMPKLIRLLQSYDFRVCAIFLLDSQFISDVSKFFSGLMVSLAAMINLEVPIVNLLTKTDLLDRSAKKQLEKFLEPDSYLLEQEFVSNRWPEKYQKLTEAFAKLVDDYALIKFMPINIFDEDSLNDVLLSVDNAIQYGEEEDVKVRDFDEPQVQGGNGLNSDL